MSKKQQSVAEAEKIVADLEGRRDALIERDAALAEERSELAFAALSRDDGKARTRLDTINRTASEFASELAAHDSALETARKRLEVARQHEARQVSRDRAMQLHEKVSEFVATANDLDAALAEVASLSHRIEELRREMQLLGATIPTPSQLESLGGRCLATVIGSSPWVRLFELPPVPPNERRTFASLINGWADQIERNFVQPHLETTEAA